MEDLIAAYPEEFFPRDGLVFKGRQQSLSRVSRCDLLFEDEWGALVVMELKARTAKPDDADQLGRYRDALVEKTERHVRMWLVAPLIPKNVRDFLDSIGIQYTEIHEPEYREVAHRHSVALADRSEQPAAVTSRRSTARRVKGGTRSGLKDLFFGGGNAPHASHPTHAGIAAQVGRTGNETADGSVLPDTAPLTLVKTWLQQNHTKNGILLIHRVQGDYYHWEGNVYRKMSREEIHNEWYTFFTDRQVKLQAGDSEKIVTLRPDRKFCGNLDHAASAYLGVRIDHGVHEPFPIAGSAATDLAHAVVFQNGVLYVGDERFAPLTPDVFLTSTLPYEYQPGRTCPKWEWFVRDIFEQDEECVDLLQEWCGYNLIASNHMQTMMFFFGLSGSGKGTIASILEALLGPARCCAVNTSNFKNRLAAGALLNKYAAIMSEGRDTAKGDINKLLQTWKAITDGDLLNIDRKYKAGVDARVFCRLTYVANEAIPFDDASQVMASRMNLLYFGKNCRKHNSDRELLQELKQEIPGIALWSIKGLKRLLANKRFTLPQASKAQLARIVDRTDPVGAMLDECVERFIGAGYADHRVETNTLYDLWKNWCDMHMSRTSLSQIGFGMKLAHMANPINKKRIMEAGKRVNVYPGIAIRPEAIQKYLKR